MGAVIGDILPLALGIMISPIPIIAAILMLLSPKAKGTSVGFLVGWVVGIVVALTVFILLASVIPQAAADQAQPVAGVIKIVLGLLMLLLAVKQWRSRPRREGRAQYGGVSDNCTAGLRCWSRPDGVLLSVDQCSSSRAVNSAGYPLERRRRHFAEINDPLADLSE